jgi:hypothetical protein
MKITDDTRVVADTNTTTVYNFESENETAEQILERARANQKEDTALCYRYSREYYNEYEYWIKRFEAEKNKNWQIMLYGDFLKLERAKRLEGGPVEITEDKWWEMLECLPPMKWCTIDGVEMFCMSEMLSGPYTAQYARAGKNYYTKTVDVYDKTTWIHNFLNKAV